MVKPDFTKIWAGSRVSIPEITSPDYVKGFAAYLGPLPPQTDDHDYIMNLQDLRALWLEAELATKTAAATETNSGIIELATDAEAQALSDAIRAITPSTLKNAFKGVNQSLAGPGYQKLPGGLIIQWAGANASSAGVAITWPIVFPNGVFNVFCANVSGNPALVVATGAPSVSGVTVYSSSGTPGTYVFSFGF